jgi:cell wall-associated NlpC family hydrolase
LGSDVTDQEWSQGAVGLRRSHRVFRGAVAAGAVITVMGINVVVAGADPSTSSTDPTTQFQQLSQQAAALGEQLNNAKADLSGNQADLARANADYAGAQQAANAAQAKEDQFRGSVDALTLASFEGARVDQLSALLTGSSARDYLDRSTDLQNLAVTNDQALANFQNAVNAATAAETRATGDQKTAQDATNAAQALVNQIQQQQQQLQTQMSQVQAALNKLSASQRSSLASDTGPSGVFIGPPGIANSALQAALTRRGDMYKWGGVGPTQFDCSGLVMWAYEQVGVSLPHSAAAQSRMGQAVSRADLQVGDLVFFGSPVAHVGIYVGGGDMINAPSEGEPVRIQPLNSDYSGARRLTA